MMVRTMCADDISQVVELERLCFLDAWCKEDILSEFERHVFSKQYVVIENNHIIGYAVVWELYENAELVRMGMAPAFRGRGFSKACLFQAIRQAASDGCVSMSLEVRVSNIAGIRLYESCGFHIVHTSKKHYGDGEDAYVMVLKL